MALTATEEALVRQMLDQQAAILSLAGNEATITSKLGATKVTLVDLASASGINDSDLFLARQGTTEKSVTGAVLKAQLNLFQQTGVGAISRTLQSKGRDIVSVNDFGAVGDGVSDDTLAIQAAIASGAKKITLHGVYKFVGMLEIPSNITLCGDSYSSTVVNVTNAGFGIRFTGGGATLKHLAINCSQDGVDMSTLIGVCTLNTIAHCKILGPGRGASSAIVGTGAETFGISFNYSRNAGAYACYYNTFKDSYIRGFDVGVVFDALAGAPENGGNGNRCINLQMADYWVGYKIAAMENEVIGGFFNNSLGNSSSDYGVAYWLTNGATYNYISPAIGEPGNFNARFKIEAGCDRNTITDKYSNFSQGDILSGGNTSFHSIHNKVFGSALTEGTYYTHKVVNSLGTDFVSGILEVAWVGKAATISSVGAGKALLKLWKSGSGAAVLCEYLDLTQTRTGAPIIFAGVYLSGTEIHLVWRARDNTTATSSGTVSAQVTIVAGAGFTEFVDTSLVNQGAVNPANFPVPVYEGAIAIGAVIAGGTKIISVTVPSTALGDRCEVSYSTSTAGLLRSAQVTATNTVEVLFFNPSAGIITPVNGTIRVSTKSRISN